MEIIHLICPCQNSSGIDPVLTIVAEHSIYMDSTISSREHEKLPDKAVKGELLYTTSTLLLNQLGLFNNHYPFLYALFDLSNGLPFNIGEVPVELVSFYLPFDRHYNPYLWSVFVLECDLTRFNQVPTKLKKEIENMAEELFHLLDWIVSRCKEDRKWGANMKLCKAAALH